MVSYSVGMAVMLAVLLGSVGIGLYSARGRMQSIEEYTTARNSVGRAVLPATLMASVMGVWILLNPVEAGATFGGVSAVIGYGIGEAIPMVAFAHVGPRIRTLIPAGHSITEYVRVRFGKVAHGFVILISLFYMFIFLAAELTGIGLAFELIAGIPRWQTGGLVVLAVLVYTAYGGLRASIVTDAIQLLVVLPILSIGLLGSIYALGGPKAVHHDIVASNPSLLDPTFLTGLTFGLWVTIAILGAEMLNQTWWQRIFAANSDIAIRRGFYLAAVGNLAIIVLAGLFGVIASGVLAGSFNASVALFELLQTALPEWMVLAVAVLALVLVASTSDSLFNAIASLVTTDLATWQPQLTDRSLQISARTLTVIVALAALFVSLRAQSVLQLFLLADLFAVAIVVPIYAGLFWQRPTGIAVVLAGGAGLLVSLPLFPTIRTVWTPPAWVPAPSFLWAFVGAVVVSTVTLVLLSFIRGASYDFAHLTRQIRPLGEEGPE